MIEMIMNLMHSDMLRICLKGYIILTESYEMFHFANDLTQFSKNRTIQENATTNLWSSSIREVEKCAG